MMNFSDYLYSKGHSSKSIETYRRQAGYFLKWLQGERIKAEEATSREVLVYMRHCILQDNSQRTIQSKLGSISHYYQYLSQQEQEINNPVSGIEIKGIRRNRLYQVLEPDELHEVYHRYPTESCFKGVRLHARKRNKAVVGFLVYQGLRTVELSRLTVEDLRLEEGQIRVQGGRKYNGRTLKLESHQVLHLYNYLLQVRPEMQKGQPGTDKLFIRKDRFSIIMQSIVSWWKRYYPKITHAEQIRASVITNWLKLYNLREVQYRAGHRYVSSTERYLQNDLEGLQEEINQFHPLG